ncbi:hypothetical protein ACGFY7_48965 [Streptomyces prunicolor]|uniref:hypothetical protein n=1 Tax=Streptomyces prunicolor TaxID=67348 RepID=UPI003712ADA1
MTKSVKELPGDPSELYLQYTSAHGLIEDLHGETLQRWEVFVRHGEPDDRRLEPDSSDATSAGKGDSPSAAHGSGAGRMVFYRIRLDQGMNAWQAMEEESEDLSEIARVLLDEDTGNYTPEASERLAYAGTDLLVMDRVVLAPLWRGFGLGAILAAEAVHRLVPGCRGVACVPGISEPDESWRPDRAEWDRVKNRITKSWERVGFNHYRETVYLLDPATVVPEEQRTLLRADYAQMCMDWRENTTSTCASEQ